MQEDVISEEDVIRAITRLIISPINSKQTKCTLLEYHVNNIRFTDSDLNYVIKILEGMKHAGLLKNANPKDYELPNHCWQELKNVYNKTWFKYRIESQLRRHTDEVLGVKDA